MGAGRARGSVGDEASSRGISGTCPRRAQTLQVNWSLDREETEMTVNPYPDFLTDEQQYRSSEG
jgi:hypothetical protein